MSDRRVMRLRRGIIGWAVLGLAWSVSAAAQTVSIIPRPVSVRTEAGHFTLDARTVIWTDPTSEPVAHQLARYLEPATGLTLRVQVGFPVSGRFADTDLVKCVQLAPGRAAHAVHVGQYANLHRTYAVLHAWCSQRALPLTGQSWEVYGDPTEDPSKLETGLFLRANEP